MAASFSSPQWQLDGLMVTILFLARYEFCKPSNTHNTKHDAKLAHLLVQVSAGAWSSSLRLFHWFSSVFANNF
jgi:hypothetical protein